MSMKYDETPLEGLLRTLMNLLLQLRVLRMDCRETQLYHDFVAFPKRFVAEYSSQRLKRVAPHWLLVDGNLPLVLM